MDRFDAEGPGGLHDREREGRPPKVGEEAEEELCCVLAGPPTEEGYEATRWTTPTLAEHLRRETGTDVPPETVRGALGRLGFIWKRPRRQLPKDPAYEERLRGAPTRSAYEERMAEVERAIEEAGPGGSVLFEDETELRRFPPLRKAWMPRGEQRSVKVPKQNGKFTLYGALDIETGKGVTKPQPKGRSDYTKSFLSKLLEEVEGKILLVWDRASWHTSQTVEEWIAEHERLEVVLLPKRAPEDNPVEDLWRQFKNVIAANLERELDVLKTACRKFFDTLSCPKRVQDYGYPLWLSANAGMGRNVGAGPNARALNRMYIDGKMSLYLVWNTLEAWYANLPFGNSGLMQARWPWSGYYEMGKNIWAFAHTTQFTQPVWHYLDTGSGRLGNVSYVSLKSPSGEDYSTIIEAMDLGMPRTTTFQVENLPDKELHLWTTDLGSDAPADHFQQGRTITPDDGRFQLTLRPDHLYSLTTTTGPGKGGGPPGASTWSSFPAMPRT